MKIVVDEEKRAVTLIDDSGGLHALAKSVRFAATLPEADRERLVVAGADVDADYTLWIAQEDA